MFYYLKTYLFNPIAYIITAPYHGTKAIIDRHHLRQEISRIQQQTEVELNYVKLQVENSEYQQWLSIKQKYLETLATITEHQGFIVFAYSKLSPDITNSSDLYKDSHRLLLQHLAQEAQSRIQTLRDLYQNDPSIKEWHDEYFHNTLQQFNHFTTAIAEKLNQGSNEGDNLAYVYKEAKGLKKENDTLLYTIDQKELAIKRLEDTIKEKDNSLATKELKIKELKESVAELEATRLKLLNKNQELASQLETYTRNSEILTTKLDRQKELIEKYLRTISKLEKENDALTKQMNDYTQLKKTLEISNQSFKDVLQEKEEFVKRSDIKLQELTACNKTLTEEKTLLAQQIKQMYTLIDTLENKQSEHSKVVTELTKVKEDYTKLQQQIEEGTGALPQSLRRLQIARAQLENVYTQTNLVYEKLVLHKKQLNEQLGRFLSLQDKFIAQNLKGNTLMWEYQELNKKFVISKKNLKDAEEAQQDNQKLRFIKNAEAIAAEKRYDSLLTQAKLDFYTIEKQYQAKMQEIEIHDSTIKTIRDEQEAIKGKILSFIEETNTLNWSIEDEVSKIQQSLTTIKTELQTRSLSEFIESLNTTTISSPLANHLKTTMKSKELTAAYTKDKPIPSAKTVITSSSDKS